MNSRTIIALIVTMTLWSSAFAAIREAAKVYDPGPLALLRFLFASATLGAYALARGLRWPDTKDLPQILIIGLLGIAGYHVLLNTAEKTTIDSGTAAFLICTSPVFTALIARFYLKEHLLMAGWIGIATSLCGVLLISMGKTKEVRFDANALLVVGSAFCASIYTAWQKPFLDRKYTALEFTTYVIWAGTLWLLVFAPRAVQQLREAPLNDTLLIVYLGVFPGAIAYVTWTIVLQSMPVSRAVSFLYLQPPLATIVGCIVLNERPQMVSLTGGFLALAGVAIVNRFGRAAPAASAPSTPSTPDVNATSN